MRLRACPDAPPSALQLQRQPGGNQRDLAAQGCDRLIEAAGFDNADAAREHGRQRKRFLRAQRDMLDAEKRMSSAAVADLVPLNHGPSDSPAATVVQLPRPVHDLKRTPSQEVTVSCTFQMLV